MAKKAAKKKSPAKRAATKKASARKAPVKKKTAKKVAAKKPPSKKAAKTTTAKKKAAKPTKPTKPAKATSAKKPTTKRAPKGTKKTTASKTGRKTSSKTTKATKATTKKSTKRTATKKKAAPKSAAPKKTIKAVKKKTTRKKKPVKKVAVAKKIPKIAKPVLKTTPTPPAAGTAPAVKRKKLPVAFLRKQQQKLLDLRDSLVSQMNGVARETLRGGESGESAFGMHQADAGSDSYDRDFALNLLSQEQDALYEIDEALKRIESGTYGFCEVSGEPIPELRLEAMPFARLTVACQEKLDQEQAMGHHRTPVTSLFGLDDRDKPISGKDK